MPRKPGLTSFRYGEPETVLSKGVIGWIYILGHLSAAKWKTDGGE